MPAGGESPLYRIVRPCYQRVKRIYADVRRHAVVLMSLARMELLSGSAASTTLRRRLWLWRHGFTSRTESLFDITPENRDEFLSEYQEGLTHGINGEWRRAMNNKLTSRLLLKPFEDRLPEFYGVVADGVARRYPAYESAAGIPGRPPTDAAFEEHDALPFVDSLLDDVDRIVCKPVFGAGGRGVFVVSRDGPDTYRVNDEAHARDEVADLLADADRLLVVECVEQSAFMADLYPRSTNTVRIVTMWDDEPNRPFVALTFARVGTAASAPLDNLHQGGLLVGLDRDTGELTGAAGISDAVPPFEVERVDAHPSTGERLVGRSVPNWEAIREGVLHAAAGLPQLRYVGWDVLPTADGFQILEINSAPDMINPQIHCRFLNDPRVRRFYERHDVL